MVGRSDASCGLEAERDAMVVVTRLIDDRVFFLGGVSQTRVLGKPNFNWQSFPANAHKFPDEKSAHEFCSIWAIENVRYIDAGAGEV